MMAALVNRAEDLQSAALGLIRSGRSARYVAGWVAAWPVRLAGTVDPAGADYANGLRAGLIAVERNATRGGKF